MVVEKGIGQENLLSEPGPEGSRVFMVYFGHAFVPRPFVTCKPERDTPLICL